MAWRIPLTLALLAPGLALAQSLPAPAVAPVNPDFVRYVANLKTLGGGPHLTQDGHPLGHIPSPVSLSHLAGQKINATVALPTSYDLRTLGKLTAVRNQLDCGDCWAFAAIGSLESALMPLENHNFSENNLKNLNGFDNSPCEGGNGYMSAAYLARWGGPVDESSDPYQDTDTNSSPAGLSPVKHLQDAYMIPARASSLDNDNLKQAVMTYGAVNIAMCWQDAAYSNGAYYSHGTTCPIDGTGGGHAVDIVGWDDNFDKNSFASPAPGNGAFLVRNSWGSGWGIGGYFYASYYDTQFAIDDESWAFADAQPTTNYARVYQYDPLGWVSSLGYGTTTGWFANVFTSAAAEQLQAVSFYAASANSTYTVKIYTSVTGNPTSGTLAQTVTGTLAIGGYRTVALTSPVSLTTGMKFSAVVSLTTPGNTYPIPLEYAVPSYSSAATASPGQSYISEDGALWQDATTLESTANVCVKAFTGTGTNPAPAITSLSPLSAVGGGAGFTLTVNGTGYVTGSVVYWNGSSRTTSYIGATELQATIGSADIASVGSAAVTVFNPAPGGGTSGSSTFTITAPETITAPALNGLAQGTINTSYTYIATGAASSLGHTLQYYFDWGDGTNSGWIGSSSASHTWASASTYSVRSQARCATHTTAVSAFSNTIPVVITPNLPDLVITALTAPATASAGGQLNVSATVLNQGTAAAGAFRLEYYLSTTATISTGSADTNWGCDIPGLVAGASSTCSGLIGIRSNLGPGTWYIGVIADPGNQVAESNKTNNARVADTGTVTVSAAGSGPPALQFVPLAPCRIMDTRAGSGFSGYFGQPSLSANVRRDIPIQSSSCGVPATAAFYSLNLTVIPQQPLSSLVAWPAGEQVPGTASLYSTDGSVLADAAMVAAGTGGAISVLATGNTDLVIDINGYFAPPGASSLQFFPMTPCRVIDTRTANGQFGSPYLSSYVTRDFQFLQSSCGISGSAHAYSVNVTVIPKGGLWYVTAWPTGQTLPVVSTLNDYAGAGNPLANAAIVPAGTNGALTFLGSQDTDLIVDINGYFAPPAAGGLNFYPVAPCRAADTRNATGPLGGPIITGYAVPTRTFPLAQSGCGLPSTAGAYSLNISAIPSAGMWYLTAWPVGQNAPLVSTLNDYKGLPIANAAIVPAGTGGAINVLVSQDSHVAIDVNGYFAQ